MDTDELEPIKKIKKIDFDELSIEELKDYILEMETEIKKCHDYIKSKTNFRNSKFLEKSCK